MPDGTPVCRPNPTSARPGRDGLRHTAREFRFGTGVVAATVSVILHCSIHAQTGVPSRLSGANDSLISDRLEITYRREFVPAETIRQAKDYLPMRRREFEQRIRKINRQLGFPRRPFIQSVAYSARFSSGTSGNGTVVNGVEGTGSSAGELIDGKATLMIAVPDKQPAVLSLDDMSLAIQTARWAGAIETAHIGTTEHGTQLVIPPGVAAKGVAALELQWTVAGTLDAFGTVGFDVRLPRALTNQLRISSEDSIEITSDQALAQRVPRAPSEHATVSSVEGRNGTADLWQIDFGGSSHCKFSIARRRVIDARPLAMFRQRTEYSVSLAGNEIDTQIYVHKSDRPLRRIAMETSADVQVRTVRWNEVPLPWRSTSVPDSDTQLLSVEIPPARSPDEDVLSVTAALPVTLDAMGLLPSIQPQHMLWQSSSIHVVVAENLRLQNYELRQAKQIGERSLSESTLNARNDSPNASVSLRLAAATSALRLANGVTVNIGNDSITSESVIELREHPPIWFRLVADISPDWIIEEVTSDQSNLVSDWDIRNADGQRILEIELRANSEISSDGKPRLRIRAIRKLNDRISSLSQSDVTPFQIRDADYELDLRSLRATGDQRLSWGGHNTPRVLPAENDLVDTLKGELIYALTPAMTETRIDLQPAESQFLGSSDVVLRIGEAQSSEEFVMEWTPQDSRLDRALVHLSQSRSKPPRWSFVDPAPRELGSRRLAPEEQQRAGLGSSGETWEFIMPDLGTAPRTIRGFREFFQTDDLADIAPSLVMLPNARGQRATVTVENGNATHYRIETSADIEATLVSPDHEQSQNSVLASYRYQPERHAVGTIPAIRLVRVDDTTDDIQNDRVNCWAWNARVDSHFSPDGSAQHRFLYRIENRGRRWIELRPTENLQIRRIMIGTTVVMPDEDQSEVIRIDLPPDHSEMAIVVDASTDQPYWRVLTTLNAEIPTLDIPVAHTQWTVWLPDNHQPVFLSRRLHRGSQPWTQQLFGFASTHAQRLGPWAFLERLTDIVRLSPNRPVQSFRSAIAQHAESQLEFGQRVTWGQVLDAAATELPASTICVDQFALAEEGVLPTTPIELVSSDNFVSKALQSAGIVFLQDGQRLVLTTNRQRGLHIDDFAATIWSDVFHLRNGPFADQVADPLRFPTTGQWHNSALSIGNVWSAVPTSPLASERNLNAWHVALVDSDAGSGRGKVVIVKSQIPQVLGWIGCLISFAAVWRAKKCISFIAGLFVVVGMVSAVSLPVTQPITWGLLAGIPIGLLVRRLRALRNRQRTDESQVGSTVVRSTYKPFSGLSTIPVWALVLVLAIASVSVAQSPGDESRDLFPDGQHTEAYRVLIPVDDQQPMGGDYLFLPRVFYQQLFDSERPILPNPPWLIRRADYRAQLAATNASKDQLTVEFLIARFEIETYAPETNIQIPFDCGSLDQNAMAIKLDGRVVQPIRKPTGDSSSTRDIAGERARFLRVAIPGTHHLQLTVRAHDVVDSSKRRLSVAIPRIPISTLTVDVPRHTEIEFPSSFGAGIRSENGQSICDLGPTDRLTFTWQTFNGINQSADTSVRLMTLLNVQPHQAILSTRVFVQVPDGEDSAKLPDFVDVTFDDARQWLPAEGSGAGKRDWVVDNLLSDKRRLRVELNRQGDQAVPIRFLLNSAAASRTLRVPPISLEPLDVTEHWLGVSVEESLAVTYPFDSESLDPTVFADAWSTDSADVDAAFQLDSAPGTWAMNVQAIETESTSDEILEVHVERRETTLRYEAQVEGTGHERYKHELRTPGGLKVSEIIVSQNGRQIDATWSQNGEATVVFLNEALTGQYSVTLTGRLLADAQASRPVPLIWLNDSKTANLSVRLFRAPNSQLRVTKDQGFRSTQDQPAPDVTRQAWRVANLQTSMPELARATIQVIDSAPKVTGQILTTVSSDTSGWTATVELRINVISGSVDLITMEVPPSWRETLSVSPSTYHQIVDVGGGQRQLRIWLEKPVVGTAEFSISGALENSEVITVPELRPANIEPLESFLRVPSASPNKRFVWTTSRLLTAAIPDVFASIDDGVEYTSYRSAGRGYLAELTATQPRENLPHVSLAEVHHVIGHSVDYGTTTFHIEPSGLPTATLTMPQGSVLLDASVGGVPAQLTSANDSRWRVALGATHVPHRLRVAYQFPHAPRRTGTWQLQAPTLALSQNENGRTLWTISSIDDALQNCVAESAMPLSQLDYALARVAALRQLFEAPDVGSMDYSDPETRAWFVHWDGYILSRIDEARRLLSRQSLSLTASEQTVAERTIAAVESELRDVKKQLGDVALEMPVDKVAESIPPPVVSYLGTETERFSTGPGICTLEIQSKTSGDFDRRMRFFAAMIMVVVGVSLGLGSRPEQRAVWLENQKGSLMFVLGVLWWFALYPPWVALLLAGVGLLLKFWPHSIGDGLLGIR